MTKISQSNFGKILADAAAKVFVSNGRMFPDFDTLGNEMAKIARDRIEHIERNPTAYKKYFSLEQEHASRYGGVSMHKEKALVE